MIVFNEMLIFSVVLFLFLNYCFAEDPEDRYNLYMQYAASYPKAQAPKRIPLTFTSGKLLASLSLLHQSYAWLLSLANFDHVSDIDQAVCWLCQPA